MSKLTALVTTLVLGSTASIALASPARPYDHRHAVAVRDHRVARDRVARGRVVAPVYDRGWRARVTVDDFGPRRYRPTWVALGAPRVTRGQECIEVRDPGTFTQLRLQSDSGFALVDRVIVEFADGSQQVADLDRRLDERGEFVELPLDGNNRRIARILVTGAARDLQVFAI